ncbi:MAG: N-acetylmuramoyl-L-alanine amidase [Burkholderiales bacterium]
MPRSLANGIAVDVGHIKSQPGAISARGIPEHWFNRDLALQIVANLQKQGHPSFAIGANGEMDKLMDRVAAGNKAALFFSVHHDSVQEQFLETWMFEGVERRYSDRYAGFSLFVSRHNPQLKRSLACASTVGAALRRAGFRPSLYHAEPIRGESKPFADQLNGVHYYDNLVVLRHARIPAILFEAGVIVNREEELALSDASRRAQMAEMIATALVRCRLQNPGGAKR